MKFKHLLAAVLVTAGAGAHAATITWNQWSSNTAGTMGTVTVGYNAGGNFSALVANYPSWNPAATWADGAVVANAPPQANGIMKLTGGTSNVNTLTFSTAVVNPVFAIWSLGQPGLVASFNFIGATPIYVAGGASAEFGGSAISVAGNDVSGSEGNGTVMFMGTYSSLSWTNPGYENWYGYNVGMTAAVPEPETYALLLAGLGVVGALARRRRA
jgi:hypothetical protein